MEIKFEFSKKATKNDEIFTVDLTLCSKCQIYGEDFLNFCGLLENMNFIRFVKVFRLIKVELKTIFNRWQFFVAFFFVTVENFSG